MGPTTSTPSATNVLTASRGGTVPPIDWLGLNYYTAKRIAARTLYSAWVERSTFEAALPPDWLRLDPTDVVDVVFPTGSPFRTRVTRLDVGADFSLALEGVAETRDLMQADGIHPAAEAQPRILDNVWSGLVPLLAGFNS